MTFLFPIFPAATPLCHPVMRSFKPPRTFHADCEVISYSCAVSACEAGKSGWTCCVKFFQVHWIIYIIQPLFGASWSHHWFHFSKLCVYWRRWQVASVPCVGGWWVVHLLELWNLPRFMACECSSRISMLKLASGPIGGTCQRGHDREKRRGELSNSLGKTTVIFISSPEHVWSQTAETFSSLSSDRTHLGQPPTPWVVTVMAVALTPEAPALHYGWGASTKGSLTNHLVTLMFNQMLIWLITVCQVMRHGPGSHMEPVPVTLASHAFFSSATEAVPKARLAATAINTISCHPGDDQQRQFVRRSKQESIHCSKPFMRLTKVPVILLASAKMKDVDRNKVPVWIRFCISIEYRICLASPQVWGKKIELKYICTEMTCFFLARLFKWSILSCWVGRRPSLHTAVAHAVCRAQLWIDTLSGIWSSPKQR